MLNLFRRGRNIVIGVRDGFITTVVSESDHELVRIKRPTYAREVSELVKEIKETLDGARESDARDSE